LPSSPALTLFCSLECGGKRPTEIECIADTGIHAVPTGWDDLVRRVSCEKDAPFTVCFGNEKMGVPGVRDGRFEIKRTPSEVGDQVRRIDLVAQGGISRCLRLI
jgi:hypothetical protein